MLLIGNGDIQWSFSQVKGTLDDEITEGKVHFTFLKQSCHFIVAVNVFVFIHNSKI